MYWRGVQPVGWLVSLGIMVTLLRSPMVQLEYHDCIEPRGLRVLSVGAHYAEEVSLFGRLVKETMLLKMGRIEDMFMNLCSS